MKQYTVEVVTTKTIKINIDPERFGDEFLKEFSQYMWDVDGVEDIVSHIARCTAFEFDPEGVGCLKKWDMTEDDQISKYGFHSECWDEDVETYITGVL